MLLTIYDSEPKKVKVIEFETTLDDKDKPRTFLRCHIYGNSSNTNCFNSSTEITAIMKLKPVY